jgi:hypothetical protein
MTATIHQFDAREGAGVLTITTELREADDG